MMSIAFYKAWQAFLNLHGVLGKNGLALTVDGDFGMNSRHATMSYQVANSLPQSGVVDDATLAIAVTQGFIAPVEEVSKYPFVQAKWFTKGPRRGPITLIVIHDMEAPEGPRTAENVANYGKDPKDKAGNPVKASWHYAVDCDSIVQSVKDEDIAWHAEDANARGIGIEHAGYARQTRAEWLDEYSTATLKRSAQLVAELCLQYGIPAKRLTADEIKAGASGLCGHMDVNDAFHGGGGHRDPGPNFPWDEYLGWIGDAILAIAPTEPPTDAPVTT